MVTTQKVKFIGKKHETFIPENYVYENLDISKLKPELKILDALAQNYVTEEIGLNEEHITRCSGIGRTTVSQRLPLLLNAKKIKIVYKKGHQKRYAIDDLGKKELLKEGVSQEIKDAPRIKTQDIHNVNITSFSPNRATSAEEEKLIRSVANSISNYYSDSMGTVYLRIQARPREKQEGAGSPYY